MKSRTLILAAALAAASVQASESMRCGKWVVDDEASPQELLDKCGKPTRKETDTHDVWGPSQVGTGNVIIGKTTIEHWIYERGPRSFVMVVTIVDGKVKSIERAE